jgi:hypothetical protein
MPSGTTTINVLSLEDFHATLVVREREAQAIVTKLTNEMDARPNLGTFQDATATSAAYAENHTEKVARATRLLTAVTAAKDATAAIISSYRTTEDRNNANAGDIASRLGGVTDALTERGNNG